MRISIEIICLFKIVLRVITNAFTMDSNVGLDYIVDNPDYCKKLASGM